MQLNFLSMIIYNDTFTKNTKESFAGEIALQRERTAIVGQPREYFGFITLFGLYIYPHTIRNIANLFGKHALPRLQLNTEVYTTKIL